MTWWLGLVFFIIIVIGLCAGLTVNRWFFKSQTRSLVNPKQNSFSPDQALKDLLSPAAMLLYDHKLEDRKAKTKTAAVPIEDKSKQAYTDTSKDPSKTKNPLSPALIELKSNLAIAKKPMNGKLVNFQIDVWRNQRGEFRTIDDGLEKDLSEVYTDMQLANNIVWLVNELGRDSQDLRDSYTGLRDKIADRLQKIIPVFPDSVK